MVPSLRPRPADRDKPSGFACALCDTDMTREELWAYENHCEQCERVWHDRVRAWACGHRDPMLDALYERQAATIH